MILNVFFGIAVLFGRYSTAACLGGMMYARTVERRKYRRRLNALIVQKYSDFDRDSIQALIHNLPSWIKFPEFERTNWINKITNELWPFISGATAETVRTQVEPILQEVLAGVPAISSATFAQLTLGTLSPKFAGAKVIDTAQDEVILDLDFKWGGDPIIVLKLKLLKGVVKLPVALRDFQLFGVMRVELKRLVPRFPCFQEITFQFMKAPQVDFDLQVLGGDLMSAPGIHGTMNGLIRSIVSRIFVWPNQIRIPIATTMGDDPAPIERLQGTLHVRVRRGRDLAVKDILTQLSDPFVKLSIQGQDPEQTKTIKNSLDPVWEEQFNFTLHDTKVDELRVEVFDEDMLSDPEPMGDVTIALANLVDAEAWEAWHNLTRESTSPPYTRKAAGGILLELTYHSFHSSSRNLSPESLPPKSGLHLGGEIHEGEADGGEGVAVESAQEGGTQRGMLLVTLHDATDLVRGDPFGTGNRPQVVMQVGTMAHSSKVGKGTAPVFTQEFKFFDVDPVETPHLEIHVYHHQKNLGPMRHLCGLLDINLGMVKVPIQSAVNSGMITDKWTLTKVKTGELRMTITWKRLRKSALPVIHGTPGDT